MEPRAPAKLYSKTSRDFVTAKDNKLVLLTGVVSKEEIAGRRKETSFSLALTIDCSPSMKEKESPGSSVTKLDRAVEGLREITKRISDSDRFSLVGFAGRAETLISGASGQERERIIESLSRLYKFGDATNIYDALVQASVCLKRETNQVRRVILLTDGHRNVGGSDQDCYRLAARMAEDGIVIDALGYGTDYRVDFISRLVEPGGGERAHVLTMSDVLNTLDAIFTGMRRVSIVNAKLTFDFPSRVKVNRLYQARPTARYYGRVPLSADARRMTINVGQIEAGKEKIYAFEVEPAVSERAKGPVKLADVQLSYSLTTGECYTESDSISIEVTTDAVKARDQDLEVVKLFAELQLSEYEFQLGEAQRRGETTAIYRLLEELIRRCGQLGLPERQREFEQQLEELKRTGKVNEAIIKAAHSVSQSTKSDAKSILLGQPVQEPEIRRPLTRRPKPFGVS